MTETAVFEIGGKIKVADEYVYSDTRVFIRQP